MFKKIYPREKYLEKIRPFYESGIVKVITGIRGCGKSEMLKCIINDLLSRGVDEEKIVYVPMEKRGFRSIKTPRQLQGKIESLIHAEGFHYIFIDGIQNVQGIEGVIRSYVREGFSLFLTDSDSKIIKDEISAKMIGRYLEFQIFPLDFSEYLGMKSFLKLPVSGDMDREFDEYIRNGGFAGAFAMPDAESRRQYTQGIIDEIFDKDIRTGSRVSNTVSFRRVQDYLVDHFAEPFSISKLIGELALEGIHIKPQTVRGYIDKLQRSNLIYECERFDVRSKRDIKREQKYYLADLSIFFALNTDNRLNYRHCLENLVYTYLVGQGFQVSIGKIGNFECSFIVRDKEKNYKFIQVAFSLQGGDEKMSNMIKESVYEPLRNIKEGYPRYIISLDKYRDQAEGVHHINAIDLFLGKAQID